MGLVWCRNGLAGTAIVPLEDAVTERSAIQFGPLRVRNLDATSAVRTMTPFLTTVADRFCDIDVEGLNEEDGYERVPYYGFLQSFVSALVSMASRAEGTPVELYVPEYPTSVRMKLSDGNVEFSLSDGGAFFHEEFGSVFASAARALRAEIARIENDDKSAELGIMIMLSEKRGW